MDNLGAVFADSSRLHHRLHHKMFDPLGLHRGQMGVYHRLYGNDGISQTDLAALMNIAPATLSPILKKMEESGYVSRSQDEKDNRVTRVSLTPEGVKMRLKIDIKIEEMNRLIFGGLSKEETETLKDLLQRVQQAIRRELEER